MTFTANGRSLIGGTFVWPEEGPWIFSDLEVDGEEPLLGAVQLELPSVTLAGYVLEQGVSELIPKAQVLAGLSGGLRAEAALPGQHHSRANVRTILLDILSGAKETLDQAGSDSAILNQQIESWVRTACSPQGALRQLVRRLTEKRDSALPAISWWVEPSGQVRVAALEYPEVRLSDLDVLPNDKPHRKILYVAGDEADIVRPRTTLVTEYGNFLVREVQYTLVDGDWRGTIYYK